ncbi:unnamed protein product [Closterium sp. NIES-64]|nr:unnamed protein product [Closterium sp. NIES-64]
MYSQHHGGPAGGGGGSSSGRGGGGGVLAGWRSWWVTRRFKASVLDPTLAIFRGGVPPKQLAFSLAAGFTAGLFPLCGLTAVLCTAVAFLLNACGVPAHAPSMMAATFLATPFELSLIIPYMRLGEFIFQADRLSVSPSALVGALTGKSSSRLLMGLVHAVVAWLITSPFLTWILYRVLLPLTTRIKRRTGGVGIGSSWEGSEGGSISIDSGRGYTEASASGRRESGVMMRRA